MRMRVVEHLLADADAPLADEAVRPLPRRVLADDVVMYFPRAPTHLIVAARVLKSMVYMSMSISRPSCGTFVPPVLPSLALRSRLTRTVPRRFYPPL